MLTNKLRDILGESSKMMNDTQLEFVIDSAASLYLRLQYPFNEFVDFPRDSYGMPILSRHVSNWILRCAREMFNRDGAEGQLLMNANGVNRHYDTATVSSSLRFEITPYAGVYGGEGNGLEFKALYPPSENSEKDDDDAPTD